MLLSCQLVALAGCSWTKYRPFSSCSRYTDTTKSMCLIARAIALRIFSGSLVLRAFKACHAEKAVQHGDPMSMYGLFSRMSRMALDRLPLLEKSHGMLSSGSLTVRSRAKPGTRLRQVHGLRRSSSVTRGGEYISATVAFDAAGSQTPRDMRIIFSS